METAAVYLLKEHHMNAQAEKPIYNQQQLPRQPYVQPRWLGILADAKVTAAACGCTLDQVLQAAVISELRNLQ